MLAAYKQIIGLCLFTTLGLLWAKLADAETKGVVEFFAFMASGACGVAGIYCLVMLCNEIFGKGQK